MKDLIGVLVMTYGGPDSLDEIPGYLADIRSGRTTPKRILEEICNNNRQIGGKSSLLEITRRQVAAMQTHFEPSKFKFYLGMRHGWPHNKRMEPTLLHWRSMRAPSCLCRSI